MSEKKECMKDIDNKLILKNIKKFNILHQKKGIKLLNWEKNVELIIIPVTINICVNSQKYKIDFVKYSKYMIDVLNDGFSGNIYSPYKNINNNPDFKYNTTFIKKILDKDKILNSEKNSDIIYNYINTNNDTKIRFFLDSIVYHNIFLEEKFENSDTEKFLDNISQKGFKIMKKHHKNLNINIIKFLCPTLGVSIFPWMKYITNNISGCMQVFLDYCTIHPEIANNQFNNCRTLIHEVGHIFGLRHSFSCNLETLQVYAILLGKIIMEKEILCKLNFNNNEDLKSNEKQKYNNTDIVNEPIDINDLLFFKDKLNHNKINIQLYPDIPTQSNSTNYNPFLQNNFPFCNNVPSNFACFMDYSPDEVLTHFTNSQIKIMHYMIRMFKPYLIKKSRTNIINLNNCKVKLYINNKNTIKKISNNISEVKPSYKYYLHYDRKKTFKYIVLNVDDNYKKNIYIENQE